MVWDESFTGDGTLCTGTRSGPRAGLKAVEQETCCQYRESNHGCPGVIEAPLLFGMSGPWLGDASPESARAVAPSVRLRASVWYF
jgi:hypothetical protein